jgi:hypothetical protein
MSIHYSKFDLNTYCGSPYFRAHAPADYPVQRVLEECRSFRRLPPRLRELSALAKGWTIAHSEYPAGIEGIEHYYDGEGYELDPYAGRRLTDAEIDAEWPPPDARTAALAVKDIPAPPGGFADPATWEEPPPPPDPDRDDPGISLAKLTQDIGSHGREYVAKEYGVPRGVLAGISSDEDLARHILAGPP